MKSRSRASIVLCFIFYLAIPLHLQAGQQDAPLVNWNSEQGIQRLAESQYKIDFFELANHFQTQPNGVFLRAENRVSIVFKCITTGKER